MSSFKIYRTLYGAWTEAIRGTAAVLLIVAPKNEMFLPEDSRERVAAVWASWRRGKRIRKGEWPRRREGSSSSLGAVTDSPPVI